MNCTATSALSETSSVKCAVMTPVVTHLPW